jgi:hypothetical protein
LLEQVTQLVAVDEFDGWRTVAAGIPKGLVVATVLPAPREPLVSLNAARRAAICTSGSGAPAPSMVITHAFRSIGVYPRHPGSGSETGARSSSDHTTVRPRDPDRKVLDKQRWSMPAWAAEALVAHPMSIQLLPREAT